MRKLPILFLAMLAASSCSNNNSQDNVSIYHEDGRAKPVVSVASLIDTTSFDCSWSLSEEFTTEIVNQLSTSGQIYVRSHTDFPFSENPFGNDFAWMKKEFRNQEFVVFLELVDHSFTPATNGKKTYTISPQEVSMNLNSSVRVRVMDMRTATPKIVLQEMISGSYFIPKTLLPTDYEQIVWGSEEYNQSPMGIAHSQLISEVVSRVSDYILLAKSR